MPFTPNYEPNYFEEHSFFTNCGSFAFNIQEWYSPDDRFIEDDIELGNRLYKENLLDINGILKLLYNRDVEQILKDFNLVQVTNKDVTLKKDEELIAFRMCVNPDAPTEDEPLYIDYHFRVKRNGMWMEKIGRNEVKKISNYSEEAWEVSEELVYTGPIAYFVKKTRENLNFVKNLSIIYIERLREEKVV